MKAAVLTELTFLQTYLEQVVVFSRFPREQKERDSVLFEGISCKELKIKLSNSYFLKTQMELLGNFLELKRSL